MDRRNAIKSIIALATAPALIKVEVLMPVKRIVNPGFRYVVVFNNGSQIEFKYTDDRYILPIGSMVIDKETMLFEVKVADRSFRSIGRL